MTIYPSDQTLHFFCDRHDLTHHFAKYLNLDPSPNKILYFYGHEGSGKSLLLKFLLKKGCKRFIEEVWPQIESKEQFSQVLANCINPGQFTLIPCIYHDFGLKPLNNDQPQHPFYGLLMLRRNLGKASQNLGYRLRFPLFDFACLWYLHQQKKLTPDTIKTLFSADTLDLIYELTHLIQTTPNLSLAKTLLKLFERITEEWFILYRAKYGLDETKINQIQHLDPDKVLINILPQLLAEDLNITLQLSKHPPRLVLLFDNLEKFCGKLVNFQDEWLRHFLSVLNLNLGMVIVIAGQTLPPWENMTIYPISKDSLDVQWVGYFCDLDAQDYLQQMGIQEEFLKESIINYCRIAPNEVSPLLLGLCVDIEEKARDNREVLKADVFHIQAEEEKKPQQLIDRLFQYINKSIEYAVYALSACRSFDFSLYRRLGSALIYNATLTDFELLTRFSFVWKNDHTNYRIHEKISRLNHKIANPFTQRAHKWLEQYYLLENNLPESIYHANRIDSKKGVEKWLEAFEQALKKNHYQDSFDLLAIRQELNIYSDFQLGKISQLEGNFYASLSRDQIASEKYLEAIKAYERKITQDPIHNAALNSKGNCLQSLGNLMQQQHNYQEAKEAYQAAITAYDQVLTLVPDDLYALNNKANSIAQIGNLLTQFNHYQQAANAYQSSVTVYNTALMLSPNYLNALNNKGNSQAKLGDLLAKLSRYQEASEAYQISLETFDHALNLDPNYLYAIDNKALCLINLGNLHSFLGLKEEARATWQAAFDLLSRSLALSPDNEFIQGIRNQLQEIFQ